MWFCSSYHLARASPLPLDVGYLFLVGSNSLLSIVVQQWVVILEFLQEMNACPSTSPYSMTRMGEFNSDDHYIYYCGQESLRRNGVTIIVNKRVWNAVLGCNLKNDRMISVCFQGKIFSITVSQGYAQPVMLKKLKLDGCMKTYKTSITNTQKRCPFHYRELECKSTKSRDTQHNRQIWLWSKNEAGQWLEEFCQENALVIANTLFQQHNRRLTCRRFYTQTSPDGQYWNQIDYILCSKRWRSSTQSAKKHWELAVVAMLRSWQEFGSLLPNSGLKRRK